MLSIYEYTSAASFLKDAWADKKDRNPAFSLRSWAKKLGFENNAPLSLMLAGKRPIPQKYLPLFISSLGLTSKEGLYLEALVARDKCKTVLQRNFYSERLSGLSPKPTAHAHEVESYKTIANPLHAILLEMTELKGFRPDPTWIRDRLSFKFSLNEIEEAIERLLGLGLLEEEKYGSLRKTHRRLTNRPDIADAGVQEYHRRVSELAQEAVGTQEVQAREFNGYAMNIALADTPKAKIAIRDFVSEFIKTFASDSLPQDETYQLNVQFFGLTQNKKGE